MTEQRAGVTATLKFPLPECQSEFDDAVNGWRWKQVVWELDEDYLRSRLKYEELSEEVDAALQAVRDRLHEIMDGNGVRLLD